MRRKLLVVSDSFPPAPSGVARYAYHTSLELCRYFDVDVITTDHKGKSPFSVKAETHGNLRVLRVGRAIKFYASGSQLWITLADPFTLLKVFRNIKNYDVILCHGPLGLTLPLPLFLHIFGRKFEGTVAGVFHTCAEKQNPAYRVFSPFFRKILSRLDIKFAVSPLAVAEVEKYFGKTGGFVITGAGVDTKKFSPHVPPALKGKNVLFFGRIDERKGADILVLAWRKLPDQIRKKYKLVVAGDGPELWKVKLLAKNLDVVFTGYVPDEKLPSVISSAEFCVFPSKGGECFGIVVVESFACAKPVIVFPPMSVPVDDGKNGFVVQSVDELVSKIKLLCSDRTLLRKLSKNALRTAREKFSWRAVSEKIAKAILSHFGK